MTGSKMISFKTMYDIVLSDITEMFSGKFGDKWENFYYEQLKSCDERRLKIAWRDILKTHKRSTRPTIEEIINTYNKVVITDPNAPYLNYGQVPNSQKCACGEHYGVGAWSPEDRAIAYTWYQSRRFDYSDKKREYLESYVKKHGLPKMKWGEWKEKFIPS